MLQYWSWESGCSEYEDASTSWAVVSGNADRYKTLVSMPYHPCNSGVNVLITSYWCPDLAGPQRGAKVHPCDPISRSTWGIASIIDSTSLAEKLVLLF